MNVRRLLWTENLQRCGYESGEILVSLIVLICDYFYNMREQYLININLNSILIVMYMMVDKLSY